MTRENTNSREMLWFNLFIERMDLVDIPLVGRKYACYKSDGLCKSRIDRIMLSK